MVLALVFVGVYLLLLALAYLFLLSCSKQNKEALPPEESDMLLQCPDCHVYYLSDALKSGEFLQCTCKNKPKLVPVCTSEREGMKMKIVQKKEAQHEV